MKVNGATYGNYNNTISREKDLGKNDFLKILSAQLQFQDPMSGGDNTEFIAQMAQFSSLEQMENLNKSFQEFINLQKIEQGSGLIGKNVTVKGGDNLVSGIVDKVKINGGNVEIVIDNTNYLLEDVSEISFVKETEDSAVNESDQAKQGDSDEL